MWRMPRLAPAHIAVLYAIVGALWILFSDRLLATAVANVVQQDRLQTLKGLAYVFVTAALLYLLIRRNERGLRRLDRELRATFDSVADGVLLVDRRGRIVEANRAAQTLFGVASRRELCLTIGEFARRFDMRTADGAPVPRERFATARALAGVTIQGYEARIRRPDGRDVAVGISAAPVRDAPDARVRLAVAVLRDMTEAKRFDEIREEFLSTAAHELKTPLAVVKAYAQLMERRAQGDPAALRVINRQVDRLSGLVHRLLDVSRLRLGNGELRRKRVDAGALLDAAVDRMRPLAPEHRFRVHHGGPAPVEVDPARIEQVLHNLLENAVKFSPGGGDVDASVVAEVDEAVVSIRDHGLGIPRESQSRIFERFYRAHAGTRHDYGGLGVGLDISREIVARHGGRIWFESEPGAGSTFHFSVPLVERGSDGPLA